jgi:hypothetical protein
MKLKILGCIIFGVGEISNTYFFTKKNRHLAQDPCIM